MLKGDPILGIRELAVNRIQFTVMGNPPLSDMTTKQISEEIKGHDRLR